MSISEVIRKIDDRLYRLSLDYISATDAAAFHHPQVPLWLERRIAELEDLITRYKRMRARYSRIRAQSRFEFNNRINRLPEDVQRHIRGFAGK